MGRYVSPHARGPQRRLAGFTLVEVLVVIAIIAVLAAVLVPHLLAGRTAAQDRAAQMYAHNVYTSGLAYSVSDGGHAFPAGDCASGLTAGAFSLPAPSGSAVASCSAGDSNGDGLPDVTVTSASGKTFRFP